MQPIRSLALSLTGALLLPGCFLEPDPLPLADSFRVDVTLSFENNGPGSELPEGTGFLLHLDGAAASSVAALFKSGDHASSAEFARDGSRIILREPVAVPKYYRSGTRDARVEFEALELEVLDHDGDGSADAVKGSGRGSFVFLVGDSRYGESFTAKFSGERDDDAPQLYSKTFDRLHVLDGLTLVASKPLQPAGTVHISFGDGAVVPLERLPAGASYVTSFQTGAILPFDTEISLQFGPEVQDLAGIGLEDSEEPLLTMLDPGMFAEDGFEGELAAVSYEVELVTSFDDLPAISGTRSLLVAHWSSALTMRVPLEEGDTHLRFQARALYDDGEEPFDCLAGNLRVGFPALDQITTLSPAWNRDIKEDTGGGDFRFATPVTTVELALPAGAGSELIFDISNPTTEDDPYGGPCIPVGLLIDDLRAE